MSDVKQLEAYSERLLLMNKHISLRVEAYDQCLKEANSIILNQKVTIIEFKNELENRAKTIDKLNKEIEELKVQLTELHILTEPHNNCTLTEQDDITH